MAIIRFYEELNDYLKADKRKQDIWIPIQDGCTIRTILSSLNVPIEEVDFILVNGQSVDADCTIQTDDRISIYPVFERFNIESVSRVRSRALRRPKFITDCGLEKLADQLRRRGLDVVCNVSGNKSEMMRRSKKEKRIILTLNRKILKHRSITHAIVLKARTTDQMVREIRNQLDLSLLI